MTAEKFKVGDAVLVEWEDSYGCSSKWEDIPSDGWPETMICKSVGWIIRKSARTIVLVPHLAQNDRMEIKQGCGDMAIPIAAIISSKKILKA
jgi:hypothetical protein